MDNNSNTLYLDCSKCSTRVGRFLTNIARIKGLTVVPINLNRERGPSIRYMGLTIDGLPAITELLLEAKPAPNLLPADPRRRALIRNFTGNVLLDRMHLNDLIPLYATQLQRPITQINLLDVALGACQDANSERWIQDIAIFVAKAVAREEAA